MISGEGKPSCIQTELVTAFRLGALPAAEIPAVQAHLAGCSSCQAEYRSLETVLGTLPSWPAEKLEPHTSLWDRLASRIGQETPPAPMASAAPSPSLGMEPEWKAVSPGLSCKLLSFERAQERVSMLVRLAPDTDYPPHTHAGVEELFLLDGELWIDDRKLYAGDYNRAEPGTTDRRVWSETGCTCVLITSLEDRLR